jgi:hypothetical protein
MKTYDLSKSLLTVEGVAMTIILNDKKETTATPWLLLRKLLSEAPTPRSVEESVRASKFLIQISESDALACPLSDNDIDTLLNTLRTAQVPQQVYAQISLILKPQ